MNIANIAVAAEPPGHRSNLDASGWVAVMLRLEGTV
jgi:hypothetical protein